MNDTTRPRSTDDRRPEGGRDSRGGRDNRPGGKGRQGGKGGDRRDRRPEAPKGRVVEASTVVERGNGGQIVKKTSTSYPEAKVVSLAYHVLFEGHDPIVCERLGQARDRLREGAPTAAEAPSEEKAAEAA